MQEIGYNSPYAMGGTDYEERTMEIKGELKLYIGISSTNREDLIDFVERVIREQNIQVSGLDYFIVVRAPCGHALYIKTKEDIPAICYLPKATLNGIFKMMFLNI